ncbi:hypothetical protein [Erythrobacter sp. CCH5-A1]|uniref:hypothetical protein n=1 Tax=Erythrobacter sp. CCH5-A1 TaxID=1768792 RepID=UPI00082DBDA2|nr:hypothetical protein [Erythrobacter sp. CCH5-A1]
MKRRQFRLVLEPAPEEVVRLTQLHRYAGDVAGRGRAPIGGVLAEYIASLFPQRDPRQVLDGLLGKGDAGWSLGTAPGQGRTLIIQTTEAGVAVSAVARILEQIAPNTLLRPMIYEPLPLQGLSEHRRSLH